MLRRGAGEVRWGEHNMPRMYRNSLERVSQSVFTTVFVRSLVFHLNVFFASRPARHRFAVTPVPRYLINNLRRGGTEQEWRGGAIPTAHGSQSVSI